MSNLNRLIWTAVFTLAVAASASAQGGGGAGGGGAGAGGGGLGGGGAGGAGLGSGGAGGTMGSSGQGSSQPSTSNFNLTQLEQAPTISAPGTSSSGGSALDTSNWLGPTYGNPYYQGIPSNAANATGPGGFGAALYGNSSGSRGGSIGSAAGGTASAAGGRSGVGGRAGAGGLGGASTNTTQFGTIIAPPVQISFSAVAKFKAAPVLATQLQADVANMISRSTEFSNPAGIQVNALGNNVTIRGTVKDEDEARTLVGMVRLTPGVHSVTNQLTISR